MDQLSLVIHQSIAKCHQFENCDLYKVFYGSVHHTKPYRYYNFQNDGTSRYFGLWLWKLVHLLNLVCSFQWCVLFVCLINFIRAAVPWQRSIDHLLWRFSEDRTQKKRKSGLLDTTKKYVAFWANFDCLSEFLGTSHFSWFSYHDNLDWNVVHNKKKFINNGPRISEKFLRQRS